MRVHAACVGAMRRCRGVARHSHLGRRVAPPAGASRVVLMLCMCDVWAGMWRGVGDMPLKILSARRQRSAAQRSATPRRRANAAALGAAPPVPRSAYAIALSLTCGMLKACCIAAGLAAMRRTSWLPLLRREQQCRSDAAGGGARKRKSVFAIDLCACCRRVDDGVVMIKATQMMWRAARSAGSSIFCAALEQRKEERGRRRLRIVRDARRRIAPSPKSAGRVASTPFHFAFSFLVLHGIKHRNQKSETLPLKPSISSRPCG